MDAPASTTRKGPNIIYIYIYIYLFIYTCVCVKGKRAALSFHFFFRVSPFFFVFFLVFVFFFSSSRFFFGFPLRFSFSSVVFRFLDVSRVLSRLFRFVSWFIFIIGGTPAAIQFSFDFFILFFPSPSSELDKKKGSRSVVEMNKKTVHENRNQIEAWGLNNRFYPGKPSKTQ